eukprot:12852534-Heterocapsa_arctica.AAC.1
MPCAARSGPARRGATSFPWSGCRLASSSRGGPVGAAQSSPVLLRRWSTQRGRRRAAAGFEAAPSDVRTSSVRLRHLMACSRRRRPLG